MLVDKLQRQPWMVRLEGEVGMRAYATFGAVLALIAGPVSAQGSVSDPAPPRVLSGEQAKALGAQPLGSVHGTYVVPPAGVYASIDNSASIALLRDLHGPKSERRDHEVKEIREHSERYIPPILMQMAIVQWQSGDQNGAVFWLHAGLIRTILDVRLCTDPSVGDVPTVLLMSTPPDLLKAAFSTDAVTTATVQRVLAWDAKTPMAYDHRWIASHGVGAVQTSLDPTHKVDALTIPAEQWPAMIAKIRQAYPAMVAKNAAKLHPAGM